MWFVDTRFRSQIESYIDIEFTRSLAVIMLLPLLDGVFPALLLSGALSSSIGVLQVGLVVFGGSATAAVIFSYSHVSTKRQFFSIFVVGVLLIVGVLIEAFTAPFLRTVIDTNVFHIFAAITLSIVAADIANLRFSSYLPRPGFVVIVGLILSLQPGNAVIAITVDYYMIQQALTAAVIGVGFAMSIAFAREYIHEMINIRFFRVGTALVLIILALSLVGVTNSITSIGLLFITSIISIIV